VTARKDEQSSKSSEATGGNMSTSLVLKIAGIIYTPRYGAKSAETAITNARVIVDTTILKMGPCDPSTVTSACETAAHIFATAKDAGGIESAVAQTIELMKEIEVPVAARR
jgi:hypothetical protein